MVTPIRFLVSKVHVFFSLHDVAIYIMGSNSWKKKKLYCLSLKAHKLELEVPDAFKISLIKLIKT